jgi:magnesium-transporting ATPase (P-type)
MQAIAVCHFAGIRVKMITGDHPETARAIGGEMGIATGRRRVVQGPELGAMSARELKAAIAETDLFARVEPEHKLLLVKALQSEGAVIAMTGDGVNDAPALRQADVGVAMGKAGTAVAREASDIVLVDDNFASIAAAVQEGRHCYDNLRKALMFLLPTNIGQSLVVLVGALFFPIEDGIPLLPLIPIQVLWVNLVTGVTLALPLAFEPEEKHIMEQAPRPYDEPIVGAYLTVRTILVGLTIAAGSTALFFSEYMFARSSSRAATEVSLERAQTMVATTVVLFQAFYLFQCRSLGRSPFERGRPRNRAVWVGVVATLLLQVGFVHLHVMNVLFHSAPLGVREWAASALAAATVLPVAALHQALRKPGSNGNGGRGTGDDGGNASGSGSGRGGGGGGGARRNGSKRSSMGKSS